MIKEYKWTSYICIIFFLLICFICSPKVGYCEVTDVYISGNSDTLYGRNEDSYDTVNPGCTNGNTTSDTDQHSGMYECVSDQIENDGISGFKVNFDMKEKKIYFYDAARIDVWGNSDTGWETNEAFNAKTFPGMTVSYNASATFPEEFLNYSSLKLESVSTIDYTESHTSVISQETKTFWQNWSANKLIIQKLDDQNLNSGKFNYSVSINELGTNGERNGLGYNGRAVMYGKKKDNGIIPKLYVYHYWVPYVAVFSYDDSETNKCVVGDDNLNLSSQRYAYNNPGECCYEYPETCCGNENMIEEIWNTDKWDMKGLCCNTKGEINYKIYDVYGDNELLPKLYTFTYKDYIGKSKIKEMYDKYCSTSNDDDNDDDDVCSSKSDYKYGNNCCEANPDLYPDICKKEPTDTCSDEAFNAEECCNTISYDEFGKNAEICCLNSNNTRKDNAVEDFCLPEDQYKIKDNLSCKKDNVIVGEYPLSDSPSEGDIQKYERIIIQRTTSDNEDLIKKINSGEGFEYNLSIIDEGTIIVDSGIKSDMRCSAMKTKYNKVVRNSIGDMYDTAIEKFETTRFKKQHIYLNDNYEYDLSSLPGDINIDEIIATQDIGDYECYYYSDGIREYTTYGEYFGSFGTTYISKIDYTITYSVALPDCYIQFRDNSKTCHSASEVENNNDDYYYAGKKYYTKINQETGVLDLNVTMKDAGLFNSISSTGDGYTCQYQSNNCIEDGYCTPDDDDDCTSTTTCPPIKNEPIFRPISLINPFPNGRAIGDNWNNSEWIKKYITDKNNSVYSDGPMYSITLTSTLAEKIREYNLDENDDGGYLDWTTMETEHNTVRRTSNFLTCLRDGTECPNGKTIGVDVDITLLGDSEEDRKNKRGEFPHSGQIGSDES